MAIDLDLTPPDVTAEPGEHENYLVENFSLLQELLANGATGTFTTADGKTVAVTSGIITNIV